MSAISLYIGHKIKMMRKIKGLTIEQLAQGINKSKATVSKYENGSISIDIDTLFEIANVLDVDIACLTDYNYPKDKLHHLKKNIYFDTPYSYMYYYDGRTKKIIRSLLYLYESSEDNNTLSVSMYNGIDSFDEPQKCQHFFQGTVYSYDTITYIIMTNQVNPTERLFACILNPLHANTAAIGIISGIGSNPFFAPISVKALISKEILDENSDFMKVIQLSKDDLQMCKYYNMMVINRPNSLFLKEK